MAEAKWKRTPFAIVRQSVPARSHEWQLAPRARKVRAGAKRWKLELRKKKVLRAGPSRAVDAVPSRAVDAAPSRAVDAVPEIKSMKDP